MRVGLVIYGSLDTVSGGYLYDRQLVSALRRAGDEVDIISLPWRGYARHLADNGSADLRRQLARGYDVLLQDELNHPSLAWVNSRLGRNRPPIVAIVHHLRASESHPATRKWLYRFVERHYLNSVDAFIYNSQTTRRAVEMMIGRSRPHVVAFPGGNRLSPNSALPPDRGYSSDEPLRLLFVGNLIPRKGLHTLLAALAAVAGEWRLRVVGNPGVDPAYARRMMAYASATGIDQRITWRGGLDDAGLATEYAAAGVLAVPSEYEGFGIVYLEGMSYGLPALATTSGAAGEIITDGVNGFMVAPGDVAALTGRIEALAADRALVARLGTAAWARYAAHPTWDEATATIREFLLGIAHREQQ